MKAKDVKRGQTVTVLGTTDTWMVIDRAPQNRWWLQSMEDGSKFMSLAPKNFEVTGFVLELQKECGEQLALAF